MKWEAASKAFPGWQRVQSLDTTLKGIRDSEAEYLQIAVAQRPFTDTAKRDQSGKHLLILAAVNPDRVLQEGKQSTS